MWARASQPPRTQHSVLGILTALAWARVITFDAPHRSPLLTLFTALLLFVVGMTFWRIWVHRHWIREDPERVIDLVSLRAGVDAAWLSGLVFAAVDLAQRWPAGWGFGFL